MTKDTFTQTSSSMNMLLQINPFAILSKTHYRGGHVKTSHFQYNQERNLIFKLANIQV